MDKKAVITIRLVEESLKEVNEKIEKDIFRELSTGEPKIPWLKSVEKVKVIEAA